MTLCLLASRCNRIAVFKKKREAEIHDPFSDLLALAESVRKRLSWFRLLTFFGFLGGFIFGLLALSFAVSLVSQGIRDPILLGLSMLVSVGGFVVSFASLGLEEFLLSFERRLDTLSRAKSFDAAPRIPEGSTPLDRLWLYFARIDERIADDWARYRDRFADGYSLTTRGRVVKFDGYAYVRRSVGRWRGTLQLFVRIVNRVPTVEDLERYQRDVKLVVKKRRHPPRHVVLLQTVGKEIPEDVITWTETNWILFPPTSKLGKEVHACPIELFREAPDGHYELAVFYVG